MCTIFFYIMEIVKIFGPLSGSSTYASTVHDCPHSEKALRLRRQKKTTHTYVDKTFQFLHHLHIWDLKKKKNRILLI